MSSVSPCVLFIPKMHMVQESISFGAKKAKNNVFSEGYGGSGMPHSALRSSSYLELLQTKTTKLNPHPFKFGKIGLGSIKIVAPCRTDKNTKGYRMGEL